MSVWGFDFLNHQCGFAKSKEGRMGLAVFSTGEKGRAACVRDGQLGRRCRKEVKLRKQSRAKKRRRKRKGMIVRGLVNWNSKRTRCGKDVGSQQLGS
jgi:hypothetical protein